MGREAAIRWWPDWFFNTLGFSAQLCGKPPTPGVGRSFAQQHHSDRTWAGRYVNETCKKVTGYLSSDVWSSSLPTKLNGQYPRVWERWTLYVFYYSRLLNYSMAFIRSVLQDRCKWRSPYFRYNQLLMVLDDKLMCEFTFFFFCFFVLVPPPFNVGPFL